VTGCCSERATSFNARGSTSLTMSARPRRLTGAWLVMRRETAQYLLAALTGSHHVTHDRARMYGMPVLFSDELELDQIMLGYEGWLGTED